MNNKEVCELQAKEFNEKTGNKKYIDCPDCKNKGMVMYAVFEEIYNDYTTVIRTCKCMEQRKLLQRAEKSGLGDYLNKRFEDYVTEKDWQKEVKHKAIEYCKSEENGWFVMLGQSGSGKTLICSIISNYMLLKKNKKVIYITWTDFISKVKRDMMSDAAGEVSDYLEEIKNTDVLFIDELLKKYNETDLKYIIEIINYRYTNDMVTIITSEKTIDELLDIDEATTSRMIEKASNNIVNIIKDREKNYRLKGI